MTGLTQGSAGSSEGESKDLAQGPEPGWKGPVWVPCHWCSEFWCVVHKMHAFECECPPIEDWPEGADPYGEDAMGWAWKMFVAGKAGGLK